MATDIDGFTLAELLTCVAVICVCTMLGIPAFAEMRDRAAALTTLHSLSASLSVARLAAVSRGSPVSVCPSADGSGCRLDLIWDDGWIVFVDPARTGQPSGPEVVLKHETPVNGVSVRSSAGRHRIRFQPSGFAGGSNLALRICLDRGDTAIGSVIVNLAGRPRTLRAAEGTPCDYTQ